MAMLVYWSVQYKKYTFSVVKFDPCNCNFPSSFPFGLPVFGRESFSVASSTSKGKAPPPEISGAEARLCRCRVKLEELGGCNGYMKMEKMLSMEKKHLD